MFMEFSFRYFISCCENQLLSQCQQVENILWESCHNIPLNSLLSNLSFTVQRLVKLALPIIPQALMQAVSFPGYLKTQPSCHCSSVMCSPSSFSHYAFISSLWCASGCRWVPAHPTTTLTNSNTSSASEFSVQIPCLTALGTNYKLIWSGILSSSVQIFRKHRCPHINGNL